LTDRIKLNLFVLDESSGTGANQYEQRGQIDPSANSAEKLN
jgi:hypothetical protein